MPDEISNSVLRFFATRGVQLKVASIGGEEFETIGQLKIVVFSNEQMHANCECPLL
jgi:hypothetical protein